MAFLRHCCGCFVATAVVPIAVIVGCALTEVPVTRPYVAVAEGKSAHAGGAGRGASESSSPDSLAKAAAGGGPKGFGSGKMFDRIAWAYDLGNKYMSLGLDQHWRQTMLNDCLHLERTDKVLDLATGTADVALLQGRRLADLGGQDAGGRVIGVDPSVEMLRHGVQKVEHSGLPSGLVQLSHGDAQDLSAHHAMDASGGLAKDASSLQSDSVDKISISFGIRNVPDRAKAMREMRRVLRKLPSSRVCILEFSLPTGRTLLSKIARGFILHAVPFIGKVTTLGGGGDEYRYLEESITKFPAPDDFAALMTSEGLPVANITEFAYGAVQLYHATVRA